MWSQEQQGAELAKNRSPISQTLLGYSVSNGITVPENGFLPFFWGDHWESWTNARLTPYFASQVKASDQGYVGSLNRFERTQAEN